MSAYTRGSRGAAGCRARPCARLPRAGTCPRPRQRAASRAPAPAESRWPSMPPALQPEQGQKHLDPRRSAPARQLRSGRGGQRLRRAACPASSTHRMPGQAIPERLGGEHHQVLVLGCGWRRRVDGIACGGLAQQPPWVESLTSPCQDSLQTYLGLSSMLLLWTTWPEPVLLAPLVQWLRQPRAPWPPGQAAARVRAGPPPPRARPPPWDASADSLTPPHPGPQTRQPSGVVCYVQA
mmetsp:Transcript_84501/g.204894  ORF Transcript_84501/g.204894 Transcript_84501/m.204894 type:complete len:237 (-) Transcript_84501:2-712(-)